MHEHEPWPDDHLFAVLAGLVRYRGSYSRDGDTVRDADGYNVVKDYLESLDADALRLTLSRFIRESYLTESQLARGQGIADAVRALDWLYLEMGIDVSQTVAAHAKPTYPPRLSY